MQKKTKPANQKNRNLTAKKAGGVPKPNDIKNQITTQYVLVVNFRRSGKPIVREVAVCQQHRTINKSTGNLINVASQAELADTTTGQNIAKRFNLSYREFTTRYSLRFNDKLQLISGFRQQPRLSKALTTKQLKEIEQRLPKRRGIKRGN